MTGRIAIVLTALLAIAPSAHASQAATPPAKLPTEAPSSAPTDPILLAAENLTGRALILRAFPSANTLAFDPTGKPESPAKPTDWTLSGVNVLKAARPTPDTLELDAVRVAIRFNPDAHEFQRHPLNDQKMKLLLKLPPNPTPRQLESLFAAIFSTGIDPALQRSMPPIWRHYFDPSIPWPADAIANQPIAPMFGLPDQPKDVVPPSLAHKADAEITEAARTDKVKGPVQLRMVVDASGIPQRIYITRPLGYGLDERAAEAIAKWRFNPATRAGKPIPSGIVVNLDFENAAPPR